MPMLKAWHLPYRFAMDRIARVSGENFACRI